MKGVGTPLRFEAGDLESGFLGPTTGFEAGDFDNGCLTRGFTGGPILLGRARSRISLGPFPSNTLVPLKGSAVNFRNTF